MTFLRGCPPPLLCKQRTTFGRQEGEGFLCFQYCYKAEKRDPEPERWARKG